jgi:two-component system response regulator QseB
VLVAVSPERATPGLLRTLRVHAFDPHVIHDGTRVLDSVRAGAFAAVVLEVGLAGVDTAEILAGLTRLAPETPVLALAARESREQLVAGLRGDRDDYLTIPFNVDELIARLRLRVRHGGAAGSVEDQSVTRHGDIMLDSALGLVSVDGQLVTLTPTEFALLTILISNPGQVLSREQLTSMLWRDPPSSNVVEVYVGYLRRKLGADRIRTIRNRGYLLQE